MPNEALLHPENRPALHTSCATDEQKIQNHPDTGRADKLAQAAGISRTATVELGCMAELQLLLALNLSGEPNRLLKKACFEKATLKIIGLFA
jgi:hypothetical protein